MTTTPPTAELVSQPQRTEADAVADIATRATVKAEEFSREDASLLGVAVPPGYRFEVVDLAQYGDTPQRVTGRTTLVDAESFAAYYERHKDTGATMYANVKSQVIVGVLNDASGPAAPGWRDHVVTLALTKTPEWQRWLARDGVLGSQVDFAQHIEDSTPDILDPDAATMLEIAQSFHAKTSVQFDSQKLLANGERQFTYREDMQASAGQTGQLEVPSTIRLNIAPFEVGESYDLIARLRFRISSGHLSIGYKLDRPDDVIRQAFADVVKDVQSCTGDDVLYGTPPA